MRFRIAITLVLLGMLSATRAAWAHNLGHECKIRGGRVEVEAYFSDDTSAVGASIVVQDASEQTIAQGRTDRDGKWSFELPEPGKYRVIVDAGDGHRSTSFLTVPGKDSEASGSDRPTRAEFTRTPWVKLGIGLGLIALVAFGIQAALRQSRAAKKN